MADLNNIWDDDDLNLADKTEASTGTPTPVPPGDYYLQLDSQELKQTKDTTGVLLSCVFTILDPEYEGRKIFCNFNVKNKNAQAQQIGISDFKALCLSCGIEFADARSDTSLLLQIPFQAKVGMSKPKDGYESRNEIKKYYRADNAPAEAAAPAKPAAARPVSPKAAAAAPGGRAVPDWMKKKTA